MSTQPPRVTLRLEAGAAPIERTTQSAEQAIAGAHHAGLLLGNDHSCIDLFTRTAAHDPLQPPVTKALSVLLTHLLSLSSPSPDARAGR